MIIHFLLFQFDDSGDPLLLSNELRGSEEPSESGKGMTTRCRAMVKVEIADVSKSIQDSFRQAAASLDLQPRC